jgi:hypothetical protein
MNRRFPIGFVITGAVLLAAGTASAQPAEDPDWPCIQRLMPELSAGMVWAGPAVEEVAELARQDREIADLARKLAVRRTPIEEAARAIEDFAGALADERARRLTALFGAIFEVINRDRGSIIAGIKRYNRKQKALGERIAETTDAIRALPAEAATRRQELQEQQIWDTRIFDERQRSLTYVCEQPVLLEQRLFALARAIMGQLEP